MRTFDLKNLAAITAFGLVAILGASEAANAQGNSKNNQKQERKAAKQQEKINKQSVRVEQQRVLLEQQRQAEWTRRNTVITNTRVVTVQSGNDRSYGAGYVYGDANANTNREGRYRIYRNGSYYNTDNRGAELLRQAVNEGYRQGFIAGRRDRSGNRNISWTNSNVYRTGTFGYASYVDRSQYQYYFRQGFQRGYQDGSNSRYQEGYDGQYEYGYRENGSMNILATILNQLLNIRSY